MAVSSIHNGWRWDRANSRLDFYYRGTRVGQIDTGGVSITGAGVDFTSAAGNINLGSPAVFATTQGQGIVHMGGSSLSGVAPAGATVTSGAIFASDTVVRKIIAAGTASNVET